MSKDTDFAAGANPTPVDPAYSLHEGFEEAEEADRQVGFEPVPRFDYYHVKFTGAKGQISAHKGSPGFFATAVVVHGPEGTVGRPISDSLYLSISPTRTVRNGSQSTQVPRTPAEVKKAKEALQATIKRIGTRLGFMQMLPDAPLTSLENLNAYAAQFTGKEAIVAASIDRSGDAPKNRIVWRSIAGLADPVLDKNGKVTGTALDQAMEKIQKFDARKKTSGRTAGSFAGSADGFSSV